MKNSKRTTLGIHMPDDFPIESYENVSQCLRKYSDAYPSQWMSFGLGWNAVAYRYRAMAEYDDQFTTSVNNFGNRPSFEELYKQDNRLFGFFVCAVSTIECFFYSTYWIGVILKPNEFASDPKNLKHLYPGTIAEKFIINFIDDVFPKQMKLCVTIPDTLS